MAKTELHSITFNFSYKTGLLYYYDKLTYNHLYFVQFI
jgi:hypothetical protein